MNKKFYSIIAVSCFTLLGFMSCGSQEQETENAFELFKKEKMLAQNRNDTSNEIISEQETEKAFPKTKILHASIKPIQDEWTKFKIEFDRKILANENRIKEIKVDPNTNTKLFRKITRLEKENNELKKQMEEYNENPSVQNNEDKFKKKMNQDVFEIDSALMTIINKNQ